MPILEHLALVWLENAIVLVDEFSNLNFHELDSIITRVGQDSKIMFCGDITQTDLTRENEKSGISNFINILQTMREFTCVEFGIDDIVRSDGKMILGYFGNTPTAPDPEIMKIASKQLSLEPTKEDVHDLNDDNPNLGIEYNKKLLEDKGLETSEENIFISATCGDKGISYLEGNAELGVRYKTDESEAKSNKSNNSNSTNEDVTKVTVNGKEYEVIYQIIIKVLFWHLLLLC